MYPLAVRAHPAVVTPLSCMCSLQKAQEHALMYCQYLYLIQSEGLDFGTTLSDFYFRTLNLSPAGSNSAGFLFQDTLHLSPAGSNSVGLTSLMQRGFKFHSSYAVFNCCYQFVYIVSYWQVVRCMYPTVIGVCSAPHQFMREQTVHTPCRIKQSRVHTRQAAGACARALSFMRTFECMHTQLRHTDIEHHT